MNTVPKRRNRETWIYGGDTRCRCKMPARMPSRAYRLILLGAPGVGKGTQAQLLSAELGACQLSTGDIFRAAKAEERCNLSPDMAAALDCMGRGQLVPDPTVLNMIRERSKCLRCRGGILLDGFPRTVVQAQALDRMLAREGVRLDAVLNYELPIETIVARLKGRQTCSNCKTVYHVLARPSKTNGLCDRCDNALFQREDDRPEAVRVRMKAYQEITNPLVTYYQQMKLLVRVCAEGPPEEIFRRTIDALMRRSDAVIGVGARQG